MRKVLIFFLALLLSASTSAYAADYVAAESGSAAYVADIDPLNAAVTDDHIDGRAILITADGMLHITVVVDGLPPNIMHQMHLHVLTAKLHPQKAKLEESACPPEEADRNGDGIISETRRYGGRAFLPFNAASLELEIPSTSYPVANKNGLLTYRMSIPLDKLKKAIQEKYGIEKLALDNRLVMIHGVPEDSPLPESIQSESGTPAYKTVPIACGEFEKL